MSVAVAGRASAARPGAAGRGAGARALRRSAPGTGRSATCASPATVATGATPSWWRAWAHLQASAACRGGRPTWRAGCRWRAGSLTAGTATGGPRASAACRPTPREPAGGGSCGAALAAGAGRHERRRDWRQRPGRGGGRREPRGRRTLRGGRRARRVPARQQRRGGSARAVRRLQRASRPNPSVVTKCPPRCDSDHAAGEAAGSGALEDSGREEEAAAPAAAAQRLEAVGLR